MIIGLDDLGQGHAIVYVIMNLKMHVGASRHLAQCMIMEACHQEEMYVDDYFSNVATCAFTNSTVCFSCMQ